MGHFLLSPYACTIIPNNNVWQNSLCNVRIFLSLLTKEDLSMWELVS